MNAVIAKHLVSVYAHIVSKLSSTQPSDTEATASLFNIPVWQMTALRLYPQYKTPRIYTYIQLNPLYANNTQKDAIIAIQIPL